MTSPAFWKVMPPTPTVIADDTSRLIFSSMANMRLSD
ncbi:hypothetical protein ABID37_000893 [Aquamicrobium terrae]|uniref:Uncharacterized protein n=1 Tax=Aquamicrobium terrae TaxID=1324945 RepID=A0ABV2MYN4_9HYPH